MEEDWSKQMQNAANANKSQPQVVDTETQPITDEDTDDNDDQDRPLDKTYSGDSGNNNGSPKNNSSTVFNSIPNGGYYGVIRIAIALIAIAVISFLRVQTYSHIPYTTTIYYSHIPYTTTIYQSGSQPLFLNSSTTTILTHESTTILNISTINTTTTTIPTRELPNSIGNLVQVGNKTYTPKAYRMPANVVLASMILFESNQLVTYNTSQKTNFSGYVSIPGNISYVIETSYFSKNVSTILDIDEFAFVSASDALNSFNMLSNTIGPRNISEMQNITALSNLPYGLRGVAFTGPCSVPKLQTCPFAFMISQNGSRMTTALYRANNGTRVNMSKQNLLTTEKTLQNLTT